MDRNPSAVHVLDSDPPLTDLDFLLPWAERIESLTVTDFSIRDIRALAEFHRLRSLNLWPARVRGQVVSLDMWPVLEELACPGYVSVRLTKGHPIESLLIEAPQEKQLRSLRGLPRLRNLRLSRISGLPRRLSGTALESLDLAAMTWPGVGARLEGLSELQSLALTGIRGLTDLRPFEGASSVSKLVIEDCPELTSLDGPGIAENAKVHVIGVVPLRARGRQNRA
ncbi:hypothetical protein KILIM_016_00920 [Kineosphaera limosa NBRC 100340]|uniref:Leucine-rich repeat domain-containing protein n=1 Tax=Kineosphaera limosa NBRC 100340 TaxID=1184609 RepID=K6WMW3_9MICO|nr:hypothetical protein KILIM_016_00920 [Kineosphaera limosa NBRC 100340]